MLIQASSRMFSQQRGVTLIELLVVITIMMTMLTLVAPIAINTIGKAEAQSEYLSFCGLLRSTSVKAFVNSTDIVFLVNKNRLTAYKIPINYLTNSQSNDLLEDNLFFERTYQYLSFPETEFRFNKNGIPSITMINFRQKERQRELNLISLLEN